MITFLFSNLVSLFLFRSYRTREMEKNIKAVIKFDALHCKIIFGNQQTHSSLPFTTPSIAIGAGNRA